MNKQKIDPALLTVVKVLGWQKKMDCIVKAFDYERLKNIFLHRKIEILNEYLFIKSFQVRLSGQEIFSLSNLSQVSKIYSVSVASAMMNVAKKILNVTSSSLTGKGVTVAFIDTGLSRHVDFVAGKNRIKMFKDFYNNYKANGFKSAYLKIGNNNLFVKTGMLEKKIEVSCALNCCHGGKGENGSLIALLESCNIPVSSGSALGLGVCMDKVMSKYIFKSLKVPVIQSFSFTKEEFKEDREQILKNLKKLDFPVILKPSTLGSSIGIEVVKNMGDFEKQALVALEFDNTILVEKAILDDMKECNVACLKVDGKTVVSGIDMPKRRDEILSFNDKYNSKGYFKGSCKKLDRKNCLAKDSKTSKLNIEEKKLISTLPDKVAKQIIEISKKVYEKLMLFGPVRIDFILDKKNKVFLNEINTVPGSLAYYFFVPYIYKGVDKFIEAILDNAIIEFNSKVKVKKEYITNLI